MILVVQRVCFGSLARIPEYQEKNTSMKKDDLVGKAPKFQEFQKYLILVNKKLS